MPGYFEVLGLPLKQGRTFSSRDNASWRAAGGHGQRDLRTEVLAGVSLGRDTGRRSVVHSDSPSPSLEIVGVVGDVLHGGPRARPARRSISRIRSIRHRSRFLRCGLTAIRGGRSNAIRAQVRALDPNQSITDVRMMKEIIERATGQQHLAARVLGLFAGVAVLLAVIGLYGVMAYSVAQRTRGDRDRRALGAGQREVLWMIVGQGLRVTLIGIVCGLPVRMRARGSCSRCCSR